LQVVFKLITRLRVFLIKICNNAYSNSRIKNTEYGSCAVRGEINVTITQRLFDTRANCLFHIVLQIVAFVGGDAAKYALPCHCRAARYNCLVKFAVMDHFRYIARVTYPLITVNHALTNWGEPPDLYSYLRLIAIRKRSVLLALEEEKQIVTTLIFTSLSHVEN